MNGRMSRNKIAASLALGRVSLHSLFPLLVVFGAGESPFLFNAGWSLGIALGCAAILALAFPRLLADKNVRAALRRKTLSLPMILWMSNWLWIAFYAWSTQYVNVAVSAALYETWPIALVLLVGALFSANDRYAKLNPKSLGVFAVAAVGASLTIASEAGGFDAMLGDFNALRLTKGASLTFAAVGLSAMSAFGFKWTADLALDLAKMSEARERSPARLELFSTLVGITVCNVAVFPVLYAVSTILGETRSASALAYGTAGAFFVGAAGTVLWRMAILTAVNLEVNAINYLTTPLSLLWLFALSLTEGVNAAYLTAGATLILLANAGVYLTLRSSRRSGAERTERRSP